MFVSRSVGHKWTDRGNVASADFIKTDLTTDGAWHSLDLSSIIPVGAKLVMLRTNIIALATIGVMKIRTNGNANAFNIDVSGMETDGFPKWDTLWVVPDASGIIEYWCTNVSYITITVTVGGWFK